MSVVQGLWQGEFFPCTVGGHVGVRIYMSEKGLFATRLTAISLSTSCVFGEDVDLMDVPDV